MSHHSPQPYRPVFKYLSGEGKRNRHNADLFQALLCKAWGEACSVMTGHHVAFLFNGDLATEDEIPSADCLLFDLEIMSAVFGWRAPMILRSLATMPRGEREDYVRLLYRARYPRDGLAEHPMDYSAAVAT